MGIKDELAINGMMNEFNLLEQQEGLSVLNNSDVTKGTS